MATSTASAITAAATRDTCTTSTAPSAISNHGSTGITTAGAPSPRA